MSALDTTRTTSSSSQVDFYDSSSNDSSYSVGAVSIATDAPLSMATPGPSRSLSPKFFRHFLELSEGAQTSASDSSPSPVTAASQAPPDRVHVMQLSDCSGESAPTIQLSPAPIENKVKRGANGRMDKDLDGSDKKEMDPLNISASSEIAPEVTYLQSEPSRRRKRCYCIVIATLIGLAAGGYFLAKDKS